MKKICLIFVIFALFVFAGCGSSKNKENKTNPDAEESVTDEDTDTTDTEPADTASDDPDSGSGDSGDTGDPDSGDTNSDTGDTNDPEEPDISDSVDDSDSYYDDSTLDDTDSYYDDSDTDETCAENYSWTGKECLPECGKDSETPCYDSSTGYIWSEKSESNLDWFDANSHCADLNKSNYGGLNHWRLPTISELRTLIQGCLANEMHLGKEISCGTDTLDGCCTVTNDCLSFSSCYNTPCYNSCSFDETGIYSKFGDIDLFWSISTIPEDKYFAWSVYFYTGTVEYQEKGYTAHTRCIRNTDYQSSEEELCLIAGGTFDETDNSCTKTAECSDKPANSVWNDGKEEDESGKFTQTWNGSVWEPEIFESTHSETEGVCKYKCAENYLYDDFSCINPCDSDYFYNGSTCVNPCDSVSCEDFADTKPNSRCTSLSWKDYLCECKDGYVWNGMQCKKTLTLGNICTGQNKCYNNSAIITCPTSSSEDFYGQDAYFASLGYCTPQSFVIGAGKWAGTIFDNNTGLIWEPSPSTSTYTWGNAQEHCDDLNNSNDGEGFAGIKTWRVPNPLELLTIFDNSRYAAHSLNKNIFPDMPKNIYLLWTSKKGSKNIGFSIYTPTGEISRDYQSKTNNVLCVSGNELLPSTIFTKSSDGKTVTDTQTGLMWQTEYEKGKTWKEALAYCQSLNNGTEPYAGYTDWRLPNRNEMASLLDHGKSSQPYSNFPDMPSDSHYTNYAFLSSSTYVGSYTYTFTTNFDTNSTSDYSKSRDTGIVRCVRNAD